MLLSDSSYTWHFRWKLAVGTGYKVKPGFAHLGNIQWHDRDRRTGIDLL